MKKFVYLFAVLSLLVGMGGYIPHVAKAASSSQAIPPDPNALYVPGEIVVGFVTGKPYSSYTAQAAALAEEMNAKVVKTFDRFALLRVSDQTDVLEMANFLSARPGVAFAEPNYLRWMPEVEIAGDSGGTTPVTAVQFRVMTSDGSYQIRNISVSDFRAMRTIRNGTAVPTYPNDAYLFDQWGWQMVGADIIWPDKAVNPGVCLVDSGVDKGHPDLKVRILAGYDYVDDDTLPDDFNGHGTHMAGIISAVMNNKVGIGGISTAKIVPVRVLTAQGWGTSLDVALGILYCASNTSVRIINLSVGGFGASNVEYQALKRAIVDSGKLVVAAAGNNGKYKDPASNKLFFPAAWAVNWVCKDGTDAYGSSCAPSNANELAGGLISVGAARAPWSVENDTDRNGKLWVDINGDDVRSLDEDFLMSACASPQTNYGAWVEMVAPGEDITSTTPVSYPYYEPWSSPYASLSGTSQAAAHVSAAAARVWSVFPTLSPAELDAKLKDAGSPLTIAYDPNIDDPNIGYLAQWGSGEAPFCWPGAIGGDGRYDMSNSKYLNVAAAMGRGAFLLYVYDAATGTPLYKANLAAVSAGVVRDKAMVTTTTPMVTLINLPTSLSYKVTVQRSGYTASAVDITGNNSQFIPPTGAYGFAPQFYLGVPRIGWISAVVNWEDGVLDLDAYIALPNTSSYSTSGWGIGKEDPGTLSSILPPGSAYPKPPFARWFRDGGSMAGGDPIPIEVVSIKPKSGTTNVPYYNVTSSDRYHFLVKTNSTGEPVVFRLWVNGIVSYYTTLTCTQPWQRVGYIQGSTFTQQQICDTASNAWPYTPPNFAP